MDNIVLCITEGERLDPRILNHLKRVFGMENIKIFPICLNIYNLYKKLSENDAFDCSFIDTFSLIKEICKQQEQSNNRDLINIQRIQVSEIFLFFDLDAHDNLAITYPQCIHNMIELFNDETGNGKLYINYPMVESYKHPIENQVEIIDIYSKNHYKHQVSSICSKKLEQIPRLNEDDWLNILLPHLQSVNFLSNGIFSVPNNYSDTIIFTQKDIYTNQKSKYIDPHSKVVVLSSFVLFLLEYFGETFFSKIKSKV